MPKTSFKSEVEETSHNQTGCGRGCLGAFIGAVLGIAAALLWLALFPPVPPPNSDGLNYWGGHVAMVMLGVLVGGVGGTFVAVGKRAFKMLFIAAVVLAFITVIVNIVRSGG